MLKTNFNKIGNYGLGNVSAFDVEITSSDITNNTASHAFNLTANTGCKIRWGDGKQTNWTSNGLYSHTYTSAGIYTIQILGSHTTFNHYSASSQTTPAKVVQALKLYSGITNCTNMFRGCSNTKFSVNIGFKVTSNVTNLSSMFQGATYFNSDIQHWDVSNVTFLFHTFYQTSFNQPLNGWDVSKVTRMDNLFYMTPFNQPLNNWNVSKVVYFSGVFRNSPFNQPLNNWNLASASDTSYMFYSNTVFNQDISTWNVSNVSNMAYMFNLASSFTTANYDALLLSWSAQTVKNNVVFSAGTTKYTSAGATARNTLINTYGWTITDGGLAT